MKKLILFSLMIIGLSVVASAQTDTTLQQYAGKYKFGEGSVIAEATVNVENGALVVVTSYGSSPMVKQADDVFAVTAFQGTAAFKRNDAKKVVGVSINAMGYTLEGTKEESGLNNLFLNRKSWKK
ncbi:MAG: hypothetical protein WCP74_06470 [Sphingobacteriia bacterium]|jgi:hypothetical protein